jgi:hypothetical protein
MSIAVSFMAAYMASGVKVGTRSFMSAATPAAWGAAAEVPKKAPKAMVSPPSGAVMSGCCRTSGVGSRFPEVSKRMGEPPAEEKRSIIGGSNAKDRCLIPGGCADTEPPACRAVAP